MATKIKGLTKFFGSFQALHEINLDIQEGEFLAILGPSGCGKTTLLRLLAGFDKPSSGVISIDDEEVSSSNRVLAPEDRNISMVFQNFALWPHMSVRDHIKFPLLHDRFVEEQVRRSPDQRVDQVLKIISLDHLGDRLPGQLSGGQKQRVAIGRAIAPEPKLLLMDEPLSSLDAELRMEMRREIQQLHQLTKASIVYVTHDQGEALAMADRIIVMKDGRIEQVGTPYEIYYQPQTEFVASFVSKANILTGRWQGNQFIPNQTQTAWPDRGISQEIKDQGKYFLRPEDIDLGPAEEGSLQATVQTKQFQGKEVHYSLLTDAGDTIIVHAPIQEDFDLQARLTVSPKKEGHS